MNNRSYYRWLRGTIRDLLLVAILYVLISYVALPLIWRHYEHNPALADAPKVTESFAGFPGDPLNVALVATKEELVNALLLAGWIPADGITIRTSLSTANSVLFNKPYPREPMSNLYLWGRRQDLAFEKAAANATRQRHHVRFWLSPLTDNDGRPLWIGASSFDRGVGFNHFTGQLTHHIAPDVDAERDTLIGDLAQSRQLSELYQVTGVGANVAGRNAGGDWYYTDGELTVAIIARDNVPLPHEPVRLTNAPAVDWKNQGWAFLRTVLDPTLLQ